MYSTKLSKHFNSIQAVRNYLGNFESIKNPGKMMSRLGLYMTKSNQIAELKASQIEFIDDLKALDGKMLTDGCSIINKEMVDKTVNKNVVSMLVRIGGAKCMLIALKSKWIKRIIQNDQGQKRKKLNKLLKSARSIGDKQEEKRLLNNLKRNENRNFNATVVITSSSKKFEFDRYSLEVAVKSQTHSGGCFTNKEFIGAAYYHFYSKDMALEFEEKFKKYALKWFGILNKCICQKGQGSIKRVDAEIFLNCNPHKNKFLLADMDRAKKRMRSGWRPRGRGGRRRRRGRGRGRGSFDLFDGIDQNQNHVGRNDCASTLSTMHNEEDRVNKAAKQEWAAALKKLRIHLPFPSCKLRGIADYIGILQENEIFAKIKVPQRLQQGVSIPCKVCDIGHFADDARQCSYDCCDALRPIYYVLEGQCGLLKNPCLHPGGYKLFNAVYHKQLDEICDGECLLFSTKPTCKTSPVFGIVLRIFLDIIRANV